MNSITSQVVDPSILEKMNGAKSISKSTTQEAQDRFMKLLVTQMRNQDPLNPLDNAQVTSQLAQLSTVTGIDKLNETVSALNANFLSGQNLQAASMIGHGVVVPGNNLELKDGRSVFGFELPQSADSLAIQIKNSDGLIVKTMRANSADFGFNSLTWDGKNDSGEVMPNGDYSFSIDAKSGDKNLDVTGLSFGLVSSIAFGSQGAKLTVGNWGEVNLADIRQIF
jgi:flagellar basal-body rod modification protein FlgD